MLAVFELPGSNASSAAEFPKDKLSLALDGVQNPGNLGTIIRIADWFGIENIYCSQDTADAYNPKVVQATMGSIARVNIIYTDITKLLTSLPANYPVYGTLLDGEDIYAKELSKHGIIVMGNEDSRLGSIFGHEYGVGLKSWGYLFMLHMLLAIIITLLYIPLFIVPNAIMMADFANASSMALGDADALPSGFKLMYYGAAVVAMFLMGYVMIWGHIAVYYAYGSIASKNANKQEAINNNQ